MEVLTLVSYLLEHTVCLPCIQHLGRS